MWRQLKFLHRGKAYIVDDVFFFKKTFPVVRYIFMAKLKRGQRVLRGGADVGVARPEVELKEK